MMCKITKWNPEGEHDWCLDEASGESPEHIMLWLGCINACGYQRRVNFNIITGVKTFDRIELIKTGVLI